MSQHVQTLLWRTSNQHHILIGHIHNERGGVVGMAHTHGECGSVLFVDGNLLGAVRPRARLLGVV